MANILVVGKYYPPCRGGTEANTKDVCDILAKHHHVTAWVFNHEPGSKSETINNVMIVRANVTCVVKGQPLSFRYWKNLNLDDVDLVLFHAPNLFATALLLLRLSWSARSIPVIITHHSEIHARTVLRWALLPLYHRLVKYARRVVVTSRKNADLSADIPNNALITVIPLGIASERFMPTDPQREEAKTWRRSISGDAPTIAFIGRHARYKGLEILIQALAQIPEAHAFIVGDGPYRQTAEDMAAKLGIKARTHFLGTITEPEKLKVLAGADVFAFPSTEVTEAFGIAQLEAMAAGVPVVASDLPTGVTDVAIDEVTALTVTPGDADALAAALHRLIDDEPLRRTLARRASQRLAEKFSLSVTLDRFCDLVDAELAAELPAHAG